MRKTYSYRRGKEFVSTNLVPAWLTWQPARQDRQSFSRMIKWVLFWVMIGELILLFWPLGV